MRTARGYTLIELMIAVIFIAAIGSIILSVVRTEGKVSWGLNGIVETRCINGFAHLVGQDGRPVLVRDAEDRPKNCN